MGTPVTYSVTLGSESLKIRCVTKGVRELVLFTCVGLCYPIERREKVAGRETALTRQ